MNVRSLIFILTIMFLGYSGLAQTIKFDFPKFKAEPSIKKSYSLSVQHSVPNSLSFSTVFHATKRPMFCKMEDNLHKRFNVWIVFRAGLDEDYRKLITLKN